MQVAIIETNFRNSFKDRVRCKIRATRITRITPEPATGEVG